MTSTPDTPAHDGSDLAALREEIDELKAIPEEELLNPLPSQIEEREPTPHSTDAIGFMGGAQNTNEECYLFQKAARLLGLAYVEHQARL